MSGYFAVPLSLPFDGKTWLCWVAIAFCGARFRRWRGIVLGQLTVATVIFMLDFRWVHEAAAFRQVEDAPAIDAFFVAEVVLQTLVVNVLLVPANAVGMWLAHSRKRPPAKAVATNAEPPPLPPPASPR